MEKIALITDSCCDLTHDSLNKYDITMFPIRIIYKDKEYLDKITITSEEMYARLKDEIPSTSLPDLHYCQEKLKELKARGFTHFIVVTVSTGLSGTHNAIRLMMEEQDSPFHIFDSRALGYPEGVVVLEAAKLLANGASYNEVIEALPDIRKRTHAYITVDTLEYLKKGGRIGAISATLGELMKLRPIITYNDEGTLYSYAKTRGKKQSIAKLKELLNNHLEKGKCDVYVLQGDAREQGLQLLEDVKDHPNICDISLETVGPSMGIHAGPGVLGFAILEK